ncbi:hypothetical protein EK21DRAFT_115556 [Setomelanomma holmii]|uniref:Uncharacterized protein n=1 Tax=Setomelanomma holmii TaxID=210430 RepID=A0A9P4H413_9PLEO|nr:hypothetical protein EK21DRAFT_115556 [Setomelanomma holmii]
MDARIPSGLVKTRRLSYEDQGTKTSAVAEKDSHDLDGDTLVEAESTPTPYTHQSTTSKPQHTYQCSTSSTLPHSPSAEELSVKLQEKKNARLSQRNQQLRAEKDHLAEKNYQLNQSNNALRKEVASLTAQHDRLAALLEDSEAGRKSYRNNNAELAEQNADLKQKRRKVEERNVKLKAKILNLEHQSRVEMDTKEAGGWGWMFEREGGWLRVGCLVVAGFSGLLMWACGPAAFGVVLSVLTWCEGLLRGILS